MKKMPFLAAAGAFTLCCAMPLRSASVTETYPDVDIVSIQDQPMTMPGSLFRSIDPQEKFRAADSYTASLNVFLIQDRKNGVNALIDAGYGRTGGGLLKELEKRKLGPEDISAVFITHIHPDHVGGLTAPDGTAAFPKARIYIARREYEEWSRDASRAGLAKHLTPNREKIVLVDYDAEVKPYGLVPLYRPGHTPGHTVFRLKLSQKENKEKIIFFVGDIVHAAGLQIPHPEFCARFDMTPETAVKSRREMLEKAEFWYGAHLPFPGIIRIENGLRK